MNKVFKWLIEDMGLLEIRNPVKKVVIPKRGGMTRDRLASEAEIQALATVIHIVHSSRYSPIRSIVQFLVYTGARLGEVLHCEWPDFDLKSGIWHIHHKSECPTKDGLGWSPKWHKERSVILFPEAIEILKQRPKVETVGAVQIRDDSGGVIGHEWHPAQFVFPKHEISIVEGKCIERFTRVDNVRKTWNTLKKQAGITDLQLKDLRTYFNHILKSKYGFSSKEAGAYLGNSELVNDKHYSPISEIVIRGKMNQFCLSEVIKESVNMAIN